VSECTLTAIYTDRASEIEEVESHESTLGAQEPKLQMPFSGLFFFFFSFFSLSAQKQLRSPRAFTCWQQLMDHGGPEF
jgi:hypothetical protein